MSALEEFFYDGEESHLKGGGHTPEEVNAILNKFWTGQDRGSSPLSIANLRSENPKVREAAVSILWDLELPAQDAVPALIASLLDPSADVHTPSACPP